ncbi:hypothetical protein KFK09_025735 [Dendrobium nobile]|uniref:Pentatricopeptide repeat-containing protein n=1 Tax=Dendrobium nobile TaxID=94219 RepID=A0A8T3AAV0_DENNO|nr:hypothetical protein KFK09_025735 [Dendrobium nobile]
MTLYAPVTDAFHHPDPTSSDDDGSNPGTDTSYIIADGILQSNAHRQSREAIPFNPTQDSSIHLQCAPPEPVGPPLACLKSNVAACSNSNDTVTTPDQLRPHVIARSIPLPLLCGTNEGSYGYSENNALEELAVEAAKQIERQLVDHGNGEIELNANYIVCTEDVLIAGVKMPGINFSDKADPTQCSQTNRRNVTEGSDTKFVGLGIPMASLVFCASSVRPCNPLRHDGWNDPYLMRLEEVVQKLDTVPAEILEWLRSQHWWEFSEMDFLMLITAYGQTGNFNRAERVLKYMNKKGYTPSVISHTALMEVYGRAGQCSKAEGIFHRMKSSGPEPSPLTYQIILKTFVEANKFEEAEAIFQNLLNEERASFKPDQKMFHMMIYMYRKAGNYNQARNIFSQMAEKGIPQSAVTFNSLMSFETSYKEVSSIYDQMQRSGIRPDAVSYTLLISAYGKVRREDEALAVFEEMVNAGVRPTRKAYNVLLDAFAISGMLQEAKTVFKSMRRDKVSPDLCSYATMISAYVNASNMDGAEKLFRRLKEDSLKPNVIVYGTLMKGYVKTNNIERVMRVYERMRMQGVESNQAIYTIIMDSYGKNSDFESTVVWFKEIRRGGLSPDQKAKNILFSLAKTPEEQEEANELVINEGSNLCEIMSSKSNKVDDGNGAERIGDFFI